MSCPAAWLHGPSWPHPVIRAKTSCGLRARHTSGASPSRSIAPGRIPSTSTSACSTRSRTVATAAGCLRSRATFGRPRLSTSVRPKENIPPAPGRSIRMTSAPRSAKIMQACGAGPMPAISTTFTPRSGPVPCPSSCPICLLSSVSDCQARTPARSTESMPTAVLTGALVSWPAWVLRPSARLRSSRSGCSQPLWASATA